MVVYKKYELFRKKNKNQKIVCFIHGGGYVSNPSSAHFTAAQDIANLTDAKIIMPIYPKAPRYNYKDALNKINGLYEDIVQDKEDSQKIFLMGDSAGGGLALSLAQKLKKENAEQPEHIILLSPWLDVTMSNPLISNYEDSDPMLNRWELEHVGEVWAKTKANTKANTKNPFVSPIYGNTDGLAPITMFVGTREIFFPDVVKFDKILEEKKHIHKTFIKENQNHVYGIMPIPEGKEARKEIADIIQKAE